MNAITMHYIADATDAEVKPQATEQRGTEQLSAGQRHGKAVGTALNHGGKAVGSAAKATAAYSTGFMSGLMSAFKN